MTTIPAKAHESVWRVYLCWICLICWRRSRRSPFFSLSLYSAIYPSPVNLVNSFARVITFFRYESHTLSRISNDDERFFFRCILESFAHVFLMFGGTLIFSSLIDSVSASAVDTLIGSNQWLFSLSAYLNFAFFSLTKCLMNVAGAAAVQRSFLSLHWTLLVRPFHFAYLLIMINVKW